VNITVSHTRGRVPVTVLQPHGDLDASTYKDLIEKAREIIAAGAHDILLDLSDVPYMSSSGVVALQSIAMLLRGEELPESGWEAMRAINRESARGTQQHLKLLSLQPRVDKTLEMAGLKQFIEVYADLATAVASFSG